jgi:diguanylate cyclase (GGDEF)-like protein
MPPQETLLIVIFIAIAANLVLGITLLLIPRFRRGGRRAPAPSPDALQSTAPAGGAGQRFDPQPPAAIYPPPVAAVPHVDPHTGLELAATWSRWLREEDARIRRYRRPVTVVLVELEGLDRLAERLGQDAADRIVPPVAATLRRQAREADRVARLSGARFGILLPETGETQASTYVERVREACDRWLAAGAVALRLSIGWAEAYQGRSMDEAQQVAEDRLNAERHGSPGRQDAAQPGAVVGPAEPGSVPPAT